MKFLAVIPARGGSKGIVKKNIVDVAGKPLLAWSIEAALAIKEDVSVFVSSDCEEILKVASKYGAKTILRPPELALDKTATEPVLLHAIELVQTQDESFDYLILLQPTSPLRNHKDIEKSIKLITESGADALISVYEPSHTPYKAFKERTDGFLEGLVDNKTPFMRRQDLPRTYMPNGAIYIVKIDWFKKTHTLFANTTLPYVMSEEKSIDIDTQEDIKKVEEYINA